MATSTMAMSTEPIGRERQRMDGIVGYARHVGSRVRHATVATWSCAAALAVTAAISVWGIARIPDASPVPVLLALLPFAVGKYVLCPLRWHALSVSGRGRWWHLRAYAEGELLGLLSSVPASADLWRARRRPPVGLRGGRGRARSAGRHGRDRAGRRAHRGGVPTAAAARGRGDRAGRGRGRAAGAAAATGAAGAPPAARAAGAGPRAGVLGGLPGDRRGAGVRRGRRRRAPRRPVRAAHGLRREPGGRHRARPERCEPAQRGAGVRAHLAWGDVDRRARRGRAGGAP